jgi:hypothetical protein
MFFLGERRPTRSGQRQAPPPHEVGILIIDRAGAGVRSIERRALSTKPQPHDRGKSIQKWTRQAKPSQAKPTRPCRTDRPTGPSKGGPFPSDTLRPHLPSLSCRVSESPQGRAHRLQPQRLGGRVTLTFSSCSILREARWKGWSVTKEGAVALGFVSIYPAQSGVGIRVDTNRRRPACRYCSTLNRTRRKVTALDSTCYTTSPIVAVATMLPATAAQRVVRRTKERPRPRWSAAPDDDVPPKGFGGGVGALGLVGVGAGAGAVGPPPGVGAVGDPPPLLPQSSWHPVEAASAWHAA